MKNCCRNFIGIIFGFLIVTTAWSQTVDMGSASPASPSNAQALAPQENNSPEIINAGSEPRPFVAEESNAQKAINEIPVHQVAASLEGQPENIPPKSALERELLAPLPPNPNPNVVQDGAVDHSALNVLDRLAALEAMNHKLQSEIAGANERINVLEERLLVGGSGVATGEQKAQSGIYGKIGQFIDQMQSRLGRNIFLAVLGGVILIVLLFLRLIFSLFSPRRKENYANRDLYHDDPAFDAMEGQDPAAKLNLARSYIDMGKTEQAQKVLNDVLNHGNDSEQEEAKTLLEKIKHPE
jgi:FimV-like protein